MSTEEDRDRLKNLRQAIGTAMEESACLFLQLPEEEHPYYLANAVAAWNLVSTEPLSPEDLQKMIEALFTGGDNDPAAAAGSVEEAA